MQAGAGRDVVVVGAGFAGLAAAWRLRERGARVVLLEREPRAGGRAGASDAGAAAPFRISTRDRRLVALARAAGLEAELLSLRPWARVQLESGRLAPLDDPGRRPGVRRLDALRLVRLPRLMRRYAHRLDPGRPECAASLDDRCLRDFGRLYFGASAVERWMEPSLEELAPAHAAHVSRVAFLLSQRAEEGARFGSPARPLGALAAGLGERLAVRRGCEVLGVEAEASGRLRVALCEAGAAGSLAADAVVLAVPAPEALRAARDWLVDAERRDLAAVRYDAAITWTTGAGWTGATAPTRVRVPRVEGSPLVQVALDPDGGVDGSGCVAVQARPAWSRAHLDASDDAVAKELADALERIAPGAARPDAGSAVGRHDRAHPRFDVGRYRALERLRRIGSDRRRSGRRVYLAGDYWIGPSVEAAVISGERAAAEAASDLGLPV
jgi:protoporphyrinogen/coproporphyrinogen III oxidase